ncbi:MAG TPA: acyltransferase [Xanthobacteraceae bacterium]|jgi:peptidoglycan/LPS O-acetylase OafA/YrhL
MPKSSLALANLRGFAILMVVAFHSLIAYLGSQPAAPLPFDRPPYGWRINPIVDSERWFGFDLFCAFEYVHLMHLMFLLSGLFVWSSLVRKGGRKFVYDRLLRLGVPFVIGVYLLMPVTYYPVYSVSATDPSWSAYWSQWMALPFWPSGPMWFLWLLLAFNLAAAALHRLAPRSGEFLGRLAADAGIRPHRFFLALVGVSALAYIPLAAVFEPWQWLQFGPFAFQPSLAPQYAIYFFAGLAIGARGLEHGLLASDAVLKRRWVHWLGGAAVAFLLWLGPTALIVKSEDTPFPGLQIVADLGFVLSSATACLALAAIFLRFAATRRPLFGALSQHAYGVYLVHYLFVIWLQYLLLGAPLFAVAKAAIVFAGALTLSWGTAAALARIPISARVMGGRQRELVQAP